MTAVLRTMAAAINVPAMMMAMDWLMAHRALKRAPRIQGPERPVGRVMIQDGCAFRS
jgi:hypothetical protein